jgi:hypothetical protein
VVWRLFRRRRLSAGVTHLQFTGMKLSRIRPGGSTRAILSRLRRNGSIE